MVFNATFNYISAMLWWSVLLVEETRIPRQNLSQDTDKLYHIMSGIRNHNFSDDIKALIAQVVGKPTTIRSRPRRPLKICFFK